MSTVPNRHYEVLYIQTSKHYLNFPNLNSKSIIGGYLFLTNIKTFDDRSF